MCTYNSDIAKFVRFQGLKIKANVRGRGRETDQTKDLPRSFNKTFNLKTKKKSFLFNFSPKKFNFLFSRTKKEKVRESEATLEWAIKILP